MNSLSDYIICNIPHPHLALPIEKVNHVDSNKMDTWNKQNKKMLTSLCDMLMSLSYRMERQTVTLTCQMTDHTQLTLSFSLNGTENVLTVIFFLLSSPYWRNTQIFHTLKQGLILKAAWRRNCNLCKSVRKGSSVFA